MPLPIIQLEGTALRRLSQPHRPREDSGWGHLRLRTHCLHVQLPQQIGDSLRGELQMAPLEVDSKYMMDRQWMDEWMDG